MDDFKIYLPLEKGAFPSGSYEKIVETNSTGEPRTRFKIKGIASTTSLDRDNEIVSKICLKSMETQINQKKQDKDGLTELYLYKVTLRRKDSLTTDLLKDRGKNKRLSYAIWENDGINVHIWAPYIDPTQTNQDEAPEPRP